MLSFPHTICPDHGQAWVIWSRAVFSPHLITDRFECSSHYEELGFLSSSRTFVTYRRESWVFWARTILRPYVIQENTEISNFTQTESYFPITDNRESLSHHWLKTFRWRTVFNPLPSTVRLLYSCHHGQPWVRSLLIRTVLRPLPSTDSHESLPTTNIIGSAPHQGQPKACSLLRTASAHHGHISSIPISDSLQSPPPLPSLHGQTWVLYPIRTG